MTNENQIKQAFESLPWHDAHLINIEMTSIGSSIPGISLDVVFPASSNRKARIVFKDCQFLKMDVDVGWLTMATNDISCATCESKSAWKAEIAKRLKHNDTPWDVYHHFTICLCPPGGAIDVLARSVELSWLY
jgi:hypothetical protein